MIHLALVAALASEPIDTPRIVREEQLAFCTDPVKPFGPRQKLTCTMARELDDCQPLVDACNADAPAENTDWFRKLIELIAPIAHVLLYLMIAAIVVAVAVPVIGGLRQLRRRRRQRAEATGAPNVAELVLANEAPPPDEAEPEAALERAEALLARGDYRNALSFSLAASLGALGRRGAIRLRKDRTNGEYLRSCTDETARPPLREIVRAVDAVEFGGAEATSDKAARATARAREIGRAATIVGTLGLFLLGCDPPKRGSDPAGDELPIAVLGRNGFVIKPVGSSLATLPIPSDPKDDEASETRLPIVVIDTEKVTLDDETQAHLLRWVESGGTLALFGRPSGWPAEVRAKDDFPATRDLVVESERKLRARIGRRDAFVWKQDHEALAKLGGATYAATRSLGRGTILGVANDDLWTNVGVMPRSNAAALVAIMRAAGGETRELRVARAEDGIPPPSNPFAALIAAGLGKGAWHALAAAILLFLCYGIRHARPRSAPIAKRRAFVEHIEATGAFYARSPSRSHALAVYGRFVELRLRELAPRGTDPSTFLASRAGVEPEHIARLLLRAAQAKTDEVPRGDELDVIDELRALLAKAASTSLTSPSRPRNAS